MATLEETLLLATQNNRVCPQPQKWNQLHQLLLKKPVAAGDAHPSVPLILAAWWDTPAMSKMIRVREHIEWAASHDCLDEIHSFLTQLGEHEWHHIGE